MEWAVFAVSAAAIIVAGSQLSRFAETIANKTGLGSVWFGAVVVAAATSLPELTTGVAAVRQGAPDLAAGDLFGASMANMATLALVSLLYRGRRLLQSVALDNVLTAAVAISLATTAAIFVALRTDIGVASIGVGPPVILLVYLLGMAALREAQRQGPSPEQTLLGPDVSLRGAAPAFAASAGVILAAAPFLASSAEEIAHETGLGLTFFGTLGLGLVTSLPELTVSVAAVRMRAYDLAIGNALGSCATNMAVFLPLELAYTEGRLLADASPALVTAALATALLIAIGIAGIVLRAERRRLPVDPAAILILVAYALGVAAVYDAS